MDPLRIYDYLMQSRKKVLDAVRSLSTQHYQKTFSIGLRSIGSTLTHIMISEWYYIERLKGTDVPPYEQWPIRYEQSPGFVVIEQTWVEQARTIRSIIAAERDWQRTITWLSFPDDTRGNKRFKISCTAGDLLTQLALHEVHHRAQIMAMLRELGPAVRPLEDLDFNALMYQRVPAED